MPQYRVIISSRDASHEESGMPIQFNVNKRTVSFIPGEEVIISETTLENLKKRAIFEMPIIKDGELIGKKSVERYPTIVLETIYSAEEKAKMKEEKTKKAVA